MTTTRRVHSSLAFAALLLMAALAGGCFNPFAPSVAAPGVTVAPSEPAPKPSTPQGALQLLRWCWINLRIAEYETLFTDDFEFTYTDDIGREAPPIHRIDEIELAYHMFQDGTADHPRARRIDLTYGSALVPIPDQRPGKTDPFHKEITTRVVLKADLGSEVWFVDGDVTFFLVRGDSAVIPQELKDRGFTADPKRWYIERWEDHTSTPGSGSATSPSTPVARPAAANPAALRDGPYEVHATWAELKNVFRTP